MQFGTLLKQKYAGTKSILLIVLLVSGYNCFSQTYGNHWQLDSHDDPFWEPSAPTMDGYTLWMLRQKMNISGHQTLIEGTGDLESKSVNKVKITNYIPLLKSNGFSSMLGIRYGKYETEIYQEQFEQDKIPKSLQHLWLWTGWQYLHNRWNYTFTTEAYFTGDGKNLYEKTGNRFFTIFYTGYEINTEWNLIAMGGYSYLNMVDQTTEKPLFGLQARYQPSKSLKILFGVPTILGFEWNCLQNSDIGGKYFVTGEAQLFVRQRLTEVFGISAQYSRDLNKSDNIYFDNTMLTSSDGNSCLFNNIRDLQQQISINTEYNISKELGVTFGMGKYLDSNIKLFNNSEEVLKDIDSKTGYFINFSLQYLKQ